MQPANVSAILAWIVFLGLLFGGYMTFFINKKWKMNHQSIHLFCGGLLLGLITFDLIPEALVRLDHLGVFIGISSGVLLILTIDRFFRQFNHKAQTGWSAFILLFLALYTHSIPTGFALGLSFFNEEVDTFYLTIAIVLHHIPEGVILMGAILQNKLSSTIFWISCAILSFGVGLTTFAGQTIPVVPLKFYTLVIGAAIGTISYIALYEIIWKSIGTVSMSRLIFILAIALGSIKLMILVISTW